MSMENGNNGNGKELVYLLFYNPMINNSGWTTLSVHKKRKGALLAMEEHQTLAMTKWREDFPTTEEQLAHPFGEFEDWRITPAVLKD